MRVVMTIVASLLIFFSTPAFCQQFLFRAAQDGMPGDSANVCVPYPPMGVRTTIFDWEGYSEDECHCAFEKDGVAYSSLPIESGEVSVVCLWTGLMVSESYHRYSVSVGIPLGMRAAIDWYGPSGDLIAAWVSPEGEHCWDLGFFVQSFPTSRDNWNKVCWRGYCRQYDAVVPEPAGLPVLAVGFSTMVYLVRRRRSQAGAERAV